MKKLFLLLTAIVLLSSHDMYLKLDNYFLAPNTSASIKLFNGTFHESENVIDRNRMLDVSLLGNGQRFRMDSTQWVEKGNTTILNFKTGEAGTWVAGVSTRARNIEMSAEDFNGYLEHDGVLDMLEWRKENNALNEDAVEKYSKHVKTIFQVGDQWSYDWQTSLGYPIEFIPLSNPYALRAGDQLELELFWEGKPLANQLVFVGRDTPSHSHGEVPQEETHTHANGETHTHSHDESEPHSHTEGVTQLRTDANGLLRVDITEDGVWYIRTIHLTHSEEEGLTHESNWATLTFEVGHGHPDTAEEHSHEHEEDDLGIPMYVFILGSVVLVGGLFFWFNRKNA